MTAGEGISTPPGPRAAKNQVLELTGDVPDLAEARRWTGEVLTGLTEDEIADAQLVVSELVTNAYEHGQHPLCLRLRRSRDLIRVEVTDLSSRVPEVGHSSVRATRGRGMVLVDRLCRQWGAVRHAVGKTVWAVLAPQSQNPNAVLSG
ncbi:Anti-sigma regulatory factor (Ser/Thr protein kinase) [Lentzea xinjiangensis]|uniref:Anti-sigma regulatory factor (Ser/Thr protein kinase) n=1 Tax=Lentzea xinjiangensis TaxID=402600 RepID=A0A1H9KLH7_9PSEU|nr:ATP-binding protein [Lentzea xinjiangensis]SEQ99767.1 Anti-sigma regulatory factor (Ser/Thr protein kinase) [Lentzea xinjiangensis]